MNRTNATKYAGYVGMPSSVVCLIMSVEFGLVVFSYVALGIVMGMVCTVFLFLWYPVEIKNTEAVKS